METALPNTDMRIDWTPQNIQLLLDKKIWKPVDLASNLGVTETTIYRWLRSDREGGGRPLWAFQRRMNAWAIELGMEPEPEGATASPEPQ